MRKKMLNCKNEKYTLNIDMYSVGSTDDDDNDSDEEDNDVLLYV
jgi:hypothetical protein